MHSTSERYLREVSKEHTSPHQSFDRFITANTIVQMPSYGPRMCPFDAKTTETKNSERDRGSGRTYDSNVSSGSSCWPTTEIRPSDCSKGMHFLIAPSVTILIAVTARREHLTHPTRYLSHRQQIVRITFFARAGERYGEISKFDLSNSIVNTNNVEGVRGATQWYRLQFCLKLVHQIPATHISFSLRGDRTKCRRPHKGRMSTNVDSCSLYCGIWYGWHRRVEVKLLTSS